MCCTGFIFGFLISLVLLLLLLVGLFGLGFLTVSYIHLPHFAFLQPAHASAVDAAPLLASCPYSLLPSSSEEEAPGARRGSSCPFPPQGRGGVPGGAKEAEPTRQGMGGRPAPRSTLAPENLAAAARDGPGPLFPPDQRNVNKVMGARGNPCAPLPLGVGEDPAKTARGRPHCSGAPRFSLFCSLL